MGNNAPQGFGFPQGFGIPQGGVPVQATGPVMEKIDVVPPKGEHKSSLIFLHGCGDRGDRWADSFRRMELQHIKCICPTASTRNLTFCSWDLNKTKAAWHDIFVPGLGEDEKGLALASKDCIEKLIEDEVKAGIPINRILIGGYSQGGGVALYHALSTNKNLAGVMVFATYLPLIWKLNSAYPSIDIKDMRIWQGHGTSDFIIPIMIAEAVSKELSSRCKNYKFQKYPINHFDTPQVLGDMKKFLQSLSFS